VILLEIEHLAKSYSGVPALTDASLKVKAGEVHALMGENGAGKSTLIKILAGLVRPDNGSIRLAGQEIAPASPRDAYAAGLRFVHQELHAVPSLSVAENIFLGTAYPSRLGMFVDWNRLNAAAEDAMRRLGVSHISPRQSMAGLSTGDQMLVKVAASFAEGKGGAGRLYVLDEPTAALSGPETDRLFQVIKNLGGQGCGVLYVSHRLDEILQNCHSVTVLRDGKSVADMAIAEATRTRLIEIMTGRAASDAYPSRRSPHSPEIALTYEREANAGPDRCRFSLRKGEVLGIAGLAGSGQSELLRAVMGAGQSGHWIKQDKRILANSPSKAWKNGLAYLPSERRSEGLVLGHSIIVNTTLPHLGVINQLKGFLHRRAERKRTAEMAEKVHLKSAGFDQPVWQLSGGNQQKVMFARAVAGNPEVLILDEPTRGVDVGAKFDIHVLLRGLAENGVSVIVASSDLGELIGMADRILVMRGGAIQLEVAAQGLTQKRLLTLCYGGRSHDTQMTSETHTRHH
jgi:ribose transport system ATP-binding protein